MSFTNAKVQAVGYDSEAYHKQDATRGEPQYVVGRSDLGMILSNPRKWVQGYRQDDDGTDATEWGTLIDTLVLDSLRFSERFAVKPDNYKKTVMRCPRCESETDSAKCSKCKCDREPVEVERPWNANAKECEAWYGEYPGRIFLKNEQMLAAKSAAQSLDADQNCMDFVRGSDFQVYCTADWTDKDTGVVIPVKTLLDLVPNKLHPGFGKALGDLKTCRECPPEKWEKECYSRGYAMQSALYMDVYTAATGEDRVEWYHVLSENVAPFYAELRLWEAEFVELGRAQYRAGLAKYAQCIKTGIWPGYRSQTVIYGHGLIQRQQWMTE